VLIPCADQRANHGALVHDGGKFWEIFADFKSWEVGFDGFELATDIGWGIHFEVEGILMPDASREVDHDDGFVAIAHTSPGFGSEKLRERQCTNGTDFQKLPA
jgi:hypothetical protein